MKGTIVDDNNSMEGLSIEDLAAQMLGLEDEQGEYEYDDDDEDSDQPSGHPAWQSILSQIPKEYHDAVIPTLQQWDSGVSRRFQKIHDEYEPYKELDEEYGFDDVKEALNVYRALVNDPQATWETIGRVYGLSPQQVSQAMSSDDDDFDFDSLPAAVRNRLTAIDDHQQMLEYMSQQMQERQAAEEEADEDAALEEVLEELADEYGDFDEDYVVGLIASGIDPEDAVEQYQQVMQRMTGGTYHRQEYPKVMSGSGGIPSAGSVDVNKLNNQDTQALIAEILRLSQDS